MTILTISSQVLFGHVGNSVADFALRRLGFEVVAVPTVILSNHKGYPDAVGEATPLLCSGITSKRWVGAGCWIG